MCRLFTEDKCSFIYGVMEEMKEEATQAVSHSQVELAPLLRPIQKGDHLVMLGSCFAQYMGQRLQDEGYHTVVNSLGTLFNPFSIHNTVRAALEAESIQMPVFNVDNEWRCWWANTRVKAPTQDQLVTSLRQQYGALGQALRSSQHLVLTLGTNVCYRLHNSELYDGLVVTNCQRQPDRLFQEWRAGIEDVVASLTRIVEELLAVNPDLQIILTVSPYRYHKYGYHGSQLSKAVLLLAEDTLVRCFPRHCCYFPAYEILLDELRDYRYYAPDGHHPGPLAVDYIWQRFSSLFASNVQLSRNKSITS